MCKVMVITEGTYTQRLVGNVIEEIMVSDAAQ